MADYLVLARKYRSTTFEEVVGQEHVARTLQEAIRSGRIAHAFLFTGTRGVGKTTVARILAKALNCLSSDLPTPTPCGKCEACQAIARGDDIDVIEIDGASNRGIDEIRELRSNAIYRPTRCRYRIYYIDEVHMLTREAFNALLKTLEEPPPHVKFIFATTEVEKLPATVISRCQRFDFRNIPTNEIRQHLENICTAEGVKAEPAALVRVAKAAAGSMRDALSLLDQLLSAGAGQVGEKDVLNVLGQPNEERTAAVVAGIAAGDPAKTLAELENLLAGGMTLESALWALAEMFRNIMLTLTCGPASELIELPESQRQQVAELAKNFTLPAAVGAIGICNNAARGIRGLASGRGLVEAALVRMAAMDKFVDASALVERLGQISSGAPARRPPMPAGPPSRFAPPDEKKKILAPAGSPPAGSAQPQVPQAAAPNGPAVAQAVDSSDQAPPETLPWSSDFLTNNWPAVLDWLTRQRLPAVGGLLSPAKVLAVEGQSVRLGYDLSAEAVRRRAEQQAEQVTAALSRAFAQPVRCEFVSTGQAGQPAARNAAGPTLSTAQRDELNHDPAVRMVMDFFGGSLANIVPNTATVSDDEPEAGQ